MPRIVKVIVGAVLGIAACTAPEPSLSDAASVWCRTKEGEVALWRAGEKLGIDAGNLFLAGHYLSTNQTPSAELMREYVRACNAAFELR